MSKDEFDEKFLVHRNQVIGYFKKKYNLPSDDLEDCVQIALLKIYKRFYNNEVQCEFPKKYLFNAVQNCIFEYLTRKSYAKKENNFTQLNIENPTYFMDTVLEANFDAIPDKIIEDKIISQELKGLLKKLSETHPDYTTVIEMYYIDNLTGPEISENLNVPLNTIKTRIFRAKSKLKSLIRENMLISNHEYKIIW
jgi:RNA polymerase sigma factor (sigma-70 family)